MFEKKDNVGFFSFGAKDVTGEEHPHKGFTYKTSSAFIENVIAKKELSLSFKDGDSTQIDLGAPKISYKDDKGKRVNLTPSQMKLVTAFAQVIDTLLNKEDVNGYIKELPFTIDERHRGADGRHRRLRNSIRAVIDIPELAKLYYTKRRIGGYQIDKIREEIKNLSEINQICEFKDARGGKLTIEAPLISIGKRIKYETKDGQIKLNKVEIFFEDVFVYGINDKFSLSPITLLQLWNEAGVNTELFTMLLFLLQLVRGNKIKESERKVGALRAEMKKQKKSEEEIKEETERLRIKSLTYKESIASLLERVDSKRYYKGKYLRKDNLQRDLIQATEALKRIGIITDYKETIGTAGERICNFILNDRWLKDEATRIKGWIKATEEKGTEEPPTAEADEAGAV